MKKLTLLAFATLLANPAHSFELATGVNDKGGFTATVTESNWLVSYSQGKKDNMDQKAWYFGYVFDATNNLQVAPLIGMRSVSASNGLYMADSDNLALGLLSRYNVTKSFFIDLGATIDTQKTQLGYRYYDMLSNESTVAEKMVFGETVDIGRQYDVWLSLGYRF